MANVTEVELMQFRHRKKSHQLSQTVLIPEIGRADARFPWQQTQPRNPRMGTKQVDGSEASLP